MALMCFHTSRFEARANAQGEIIVYDEQDEKLWNTTLIEKGKYYLGQAAAGTQLSKFHLEAGIAYWHTHKEDTAEKWENILQLYNYLLVLEYSPIVALNRTFALAKTNGNKEAIAEAEKLNLTDNHFYYSLLGYLYTGIDKSKALKNFETALTLASSSADRLSIAKKIERLKH